MADKEYKFVSGKGSVFTKGDLNIRRLSPSQSGQIIKSVKAGTQLTYIGYVVDGENVGGRSSQWFITPEGDFFWGGNVGAEAPSKTTFTKPLDKLICTQRFGERPEFYKNYGSPKGHNGMDFRTKQASGAFEVPVYAVLDGTISEATENLNNGKFIRIDHVNNYQSVYLHLSVISVKAGAKVKAGSQIGVSGNSGAASEAPHLHFGYRPIAFDKNNGYMGYIDPTPFFTDQITYV